MLPRVGFSSVVFFWLCISPNVFSWPTEFDRSGPPTTVESERASVPNTFRPGKTVVRLLIASDEEIEQLKVAIEEGEHAVDHPMDVEGFWRKKAELLRHPKGAFDLRRSFENVARLVHLSKDFESPILRDFLVSSAVMFGITHGTEATTGVIFGTKALLHFLVSGSYAALLAGDPAAFATTFDMTQLAAAAGWFGLALPGLYDIGCFGGQAALFIRPTRYLFTKTRKAVAWAAGEASNALGGPRLMEALFSIRSARERVLAAIEKQAGAREPIELEINNRELIEASDRLQSYELKLIPSALGNEDRATLELHLIAPSRKTAATLLFKEAPDQTLILAQSAIDTEAIREGSPADFKRAFSGLGWNVTGAMRQIRKLLERDQRHLIEKEKTFIDEVVNISPSQMEIRFRPDAIWLGTKRMFRRQALWSKCKEFLMGASGEPSHGS